MAPPTDVRRLRRLAAHLRGSATCSASPGAVGGAAAGWAAVEGPDAASILAQVSDPLGALARGDIPGIVIRGAYSQHQCGPLVERLVERELMRPPGAPVEHITPRETVPVVDGAGNRVGEGDQLPQKGWRYAATPSIEALCAIPPPTTPQARLGARCPL